jgi:hypothetical protein
VRSARRPRRVDAVDDAQVLRPRGSRGGLRRRARTPETLYAARAPEVAAALVAHRDKVRDALATSLAPAIDRSGLPPSLRSPKGLAQAVIAIHDGAATELLLDSDPDRFRDRLTDLLTALLDHPTSKFSTANATQPS